jgi:putative oxidoreductase
MPGMLGIHPAWGLTAVRVAMGAILFVAGLDKWRVGIGVTSANFAKWDIPLPEVAAPLVGVLEVAGGALLVLGVLTRWVALLFMLQFAVAAFWVKYRLFGWDTGRVDLMFVACGLLLWLHGPGKAALQRH